MREYETTLIIQPEISDEGVVEIQGRLDQLLSDGGATRLAYEDLGKRRMAYEIQNFQKGRYVMLQFLDEGSVITPLERAIRLEDSIIRFLTVQVNDDVADIPARVAAAAEEERIRAEKAAARAAREAEEAARQEAEAAEARSEATRSDDDDSDSDEERAAAADEDSDDDDDDDDEDDDRNEEGSS